MLKRFALPLIFATGLAFAGPAGEAGRYVEADDYLHSVFVAEVPAARTLWVTADLRENVERILGHRFSGLRVRYWADEATSAWILDEIGKELPITIGVAVANGAIADVEVLEFRESRGWEVRYPFFTDQFADARLGPDQTLDRRIDGITGATMSVDAVTRVARIALLLHEHVAATD